MGVCHQFCLDQSHIRLMSALEINLCFPSKAKRQYDLTVIFLDQLLCCNWQILESGNGIPLYLDIWCRFLQHPNRKRSHVNARETGVSYSNLNRTSSPSFNPKCSLKLTGETISIVVLSWAVFSGTTIAPSTSSLSMTKYVSTGAKSSVGPLILSGFLRRDLDLASIFRSRVPGNGSKPRLFLNCSRYFVT